MLHLGCYEIGSTVDFLFVTTAPDTGAPATLSGTPVISAYVGNSTTQITAGISLSVDFDSVTGLNHVRATLTTGNGYTDDTDVMFVITTGTVDGNSAVGYVVARCTLGRAAVDFAQALPSSPTADTVGDALKQATIEEAPKKNVALSDIPFYMVDDTDGKTPETGLTVTAEVSKDGGAFASAGGSVTEIGSGVYHFDAAQADMNADVVVLKFTATGARAAIVAFSTVE